MDIPQTLVVFGAGASAFCQLPNTQLPSFATQLPPLTTDLTNRLRSQRLDSQISSLLAAIDEHRRRNINADFEATLRLLFDQFKSDPVMVSQFDQLRCSIRELMRASLIIGRETPTAYTLFFDKFLSSTERMQTGRRLAVLNMNYDPLAEYAMNARKPFETMDGYLGSTIRPISLFHPHGAALWASSINEDGTPLYARSKGGGFKQGEHPAIALPMSGDPQNKTCWPEFHRTSFIEALSSVTKICIIGWRGADEHIVTMLASKLRPEKVDTFHIVGVDSEALNITESLLRNCSKLPAEKFPCGFLSYVETDSCRALLPTDF